MLKDKRLCDALSSILPLPYTGNCYRLVNLKYILSGDQPLSGYGAFMTGGRFNKKGSFRCVYLCETLETVQAEVFGFNKPTFPPYLLITAEICLSKVLDLTNESNIEKLDTTIQELTGNWELINKTGKLSSTQILGECAYNSGYEAIKYYSAKSKSVNINLAVFVEKLSGSSYMRVNDSENLIEKFSVK